MNAKGNSTYKSCNTNYSEFDICFKYYEKAIEGRNFHYQNYNMWGNYYAIFTGALFIGYYSTINNDNELCSSLIILLGYITSICWHLTVKGHYHWMISWIKVVQSYEKELSRMLKKMGQNDWYVYSVYSNSSCNKYQKNISSQKLTATFTLIICIAWLVLLFFEFRKVEAFVKFVSILGFQDNYIMVGTFMICVLVSVISLCFLDNPSDVSKMKESISEEQGDCVND